MDNNKPIVYYTNNIGVGSSNFDFTLVIGHRIGQDNVNKAPNPEDVLCNIVMSPQHAKAFAGVLMQNIKQYEELFGPIILEPNKEKYEEMIRKLGSKE